MHLALGGVEVLCWKAVAVEMANIMAKEMVPTVLSCSVWGCKLAKHSVCEQCDNFSIVAAIKKGSARDNIVIHLLRCP